jgi:hypothetical protein
MFPPAFPRFSSSSSCSSNSILAGHSRGCPWRGPPLCKVTWLCTNCAAGKYSGASAATVCTDCVGEHSAAVGASLTTCADCKAGKYTASAGLPDFNLPSCSKMPMSISSPKCQCQHPRQTTDVNSFAKMHHSRAPHSFSVSLPRAGFIQNCPALGVLRLLYLLGFDSHSALPISAQNMSIELYLARSATHRPNLS